MKLGSLDWSPADSWQLTLDGDKFAVWTSAPVKLLASFAHSFSTRKRRQTIRSPGLESTIPAPAAGAEKSEQRFLTPLFDRN